MLAEFAEYREHFGWPRTLTRAAYLLGQRALGISILDCLRLTLEELDPACLDPESKFECRFLANGEVAAFSSDPVYDLPPDVADESLRNGDRCFGILDGDRLASYGWYARRPTTIMADWSIRFDPRYIYMYRGFTIPRYRGLRLHSLGVARALETLDREGTKGLLSNCERTNYRSWVSVARMGWVRCGTFYRLDIGPRSLLHASDECRNHGLSVGLAARSDPGHGD